MTEAERRVPAIALRDAAVVAGRQRILDGLDLTFAAASRVAIIGPSGAGKTTLLRLIGGVLWPSSGEVHTLGMPIGGLDGRSMRALRARIGFLHQQDNLVPGLRVAHNVLMGNLGRWSLWRSLRSLIWPQDVAAARAALERVELGDKLWAHPGTLSGGEQQRVAFARLLVQQPELILADEPVSALDLRLGREVVRLLLGLARDRRATLVVSLHTLELLGEGFDRVIALRQGRVFWDGAPGELHRELLRELYGAEYHALHLDELEMRSPAT